MNIKIITTEKIDKGFIKKGVKEYSKRLGRYCKIKHIPLKKIGDVSRNIKDKDYVILVSTKGEMVSSEKLADHLSSLGIVGNSDITFIIAHNELPKQQSNMHLALSSMEMDYQLMTLTLYEQIYRAFTIINNLPYHK